MKMKAISIDDERPNLLLVEAMAEEIGLEVRSFLDPVSAVKELSENGFDMVFVDFNMPGMNGIEVIERIRSFAADIPIIMITAVAGDYDLKLNALKAGATEFLNKPLNMAEFKARVTNLLDLRKSQLLLKDRALLLEGEIRKATKYIAERELETLTVLGRVSEYKDEETGAHISRVAHYSRLLAGAAGEDEEACDVIFHAAPLHDIGKIGISDRILTKPGALTPEENREMRRHPEIGYTMLSGARSTYLQAGALISLTHHEKYDGSGYPKGLRDEEIHIFGRIVSLADVFDALYSRRPYKEPWNLEKVTEFIVSQKGKHFDPVLVDLLMAHIDEISAIYNSIRDPE